MEMPKGKLPIRSSEASLLNIAVRHAFMGRGRLNSEEGRSFGSRMREIIFATAITGKRSPSSVSRELKRNKVNGAYDAQKASHKAYVKRKYSKYQGMKVVGYREKERSRYERSSQTAYSLMIVLRKSIGVCASEIMKETPWGSQDTHLRKHWSWCGNGCRGNCLGSKYHN